MDKGVGMCFATPEASRRSHLELAMAVEGPQLGVLYWPAVLRAVRPNVLLALTAVVLAAVVMVDRLPSRFWARDGRPLVGPGPAASQSPVAWPAAVAAQEYVVQPGDTLSTIALHLGTTIDELVAANGLADPDQIAVGQRLVLRPTAVRDGPAIFLVPDRELVFGPAYVGFDAAAFVREQGGYLASYRELVAGESLSGGEIVARVAEEFLVGPRLLLAILEARSGWVTGVPTDETALAYPAGLVDPGRMGLWRQLNWLADNLNRGYYNWHNRNNRTYLLADGTRLACPTAIGAASCAVHLAMAQGSYEVELETRLASVVAAYERLFGAPAAGAAVGGRSRPAFPALQLPFAKGERWWFTGGPHGGWADGSAWAAIDLVPDEDRTGCYVATRPARAVAGGVVTTVRPGSLWLDLDGDGLRQTGPDVFYLHLSIAAAITEGVRVAAGDVLGYPSCEGGVSSATHLHLARAWDGEWLPAVGPDPLTLGGWHVASSTQRYEGSLQHADGRRREACECRVVGYNDVTW